MKRTLINNMKNVRDVPSTSEWRKDVNISFYEFL